MKGNAMGIALFTTAKLLTPLQTFLSDCVIAASRRWHGAAPTNSSSARPTPSFAICGTRTATQRPLRVVRVLDGVQGNRAFGRMVISGRMADVCAELDRLAATEALNV
jgi:hypothetical protein